jgi:PIN domain nuclease of toxin-antitoxin system
MSLLLWSHSEPERLTERVAAALADEPNELWLSPIS